MTFRLLLAMSGHGIQASGPTGEEEAYYCPFGCESNDESSFVPLSVILQTRGNIGPNDVKKSSRR